MSDTLQEALKNCKSYADEGYNIARESCNKVKEALYDELRKLFEAENQQNQIGRLENTHILEQQEQALKEFEFKLDTLEKDLERLHTNNKDFSIVVFGRTMAGKSTLMEILTHGNGSTIGNGSQRTTRDVRDYEWQGLKITDVPGIASFGDEGRDDDKLAFEAAKAADLIVFLITDDAPQKEEAERLAELLNLGKPVLGIVNVKEALNMNRRALCIRKIQIKLADTERLQSIQKQFKAYAGDFNQDWDNIEFVYTHLRAAFLSKFENTNDEELFEISNFKQVEDHILNKVRQDGCFLRIKTFIDNAVIPMQKQMELLLEHSSANANTALTYRYNWHKLDDWYNGTENNDGFLKRTNQRYNSFCKKLRMNIADEIEVFADIYYDDEDAGEMWNDRVQQMNLEGRCSDFLYSIAEEAARKRRELTDELKTNIDFNSSVGDIGHIWIPDTTSFQNFFQLGSAGLGLATGALALGPVGWIAAGAFGLFSLFSDSKAEKIREAKRSMRSELHKHMDPAIDKICNKVKDVIDNKILKEGIHGLEQNLVDMDEMLFTLASQQKTSAQDLNTNIYQLNIRLLGEAASYVNAATDGGMYRISRIPGQICYCMGNVNTSANDFMNMAKLLGEKIKYIEVSTTEENGRLKEWEVIENWIGEWYDDSLYFREGSKLRCFRLPSNPNYEDIKNKPEFRLAIQVRCQPLINV